MKNEDKQLQDQINDANYFISENITTRDTLMGTIDCHYINKNTHVIEKFSSICVLINPYIAMVPKGSFNNELISNISLRISYVPYVSKFRNDFVSNFVHENALEKEKMNIINRLSIFNEEEAYTEKISDWGFIILTSPIGELLKELSLNLDNYYFRLKKQFRPNDEIKTVLSYYDEKIISKPVEKFILHWDDSSFYLMVDPDFNLKSFGFIYLEKNLKIIAILDGNKSEVLSFKKISEMVDYKNDQILKLKFDSITNGASLSKIRFVKIRYISKYDASDFKYTFDNLTKSYFLDVGCLNFNRSAYLDIDKNLTYDTVLTVFVSGIKLINKFAKKLRFNSKSLDKKLLTKRLIHSNVDNFKITSLDLTGYHLTLEQLIILTESFYNVKNMSYLDLTRNRINFERALVVSRFLFKNKSLKSLILRDMKLGQAGLYVILQSLIYSENKTLRSLNISENDFIAAPNEVKEHEEYFEGVNYPKPDDLIFLSNLIEISSLKELYMINMKFSSKKMNIIFEKINEKISEKINNELEPNDDMMKMEKQKDVLSDSIIINRLADITLLNLSNNILTDNIGTIGNFLNLSKSCEEIYLSKCRIDDQSLKILLNSLVDRNSTSLKYLDLSKNEISWKGADYLKKTLSKIFKKKVPQNENNKKIEFSLDLSENSSLKHEGVENICGGLINYPYEINLYLNKIGGINEHGLDALENLLNLQRKVKTLSLSKNNITDNLIINSKLNSALLNSRLTILDLHENEISIESLLFLMQLAKNKKSFKILCNPFDLEKIPIENSNDINKKFEECFKHVEFIYKNKKNK